MIFALLLVAIAVAATKAHSRETKQRCAPHQGETALYFLELRAQMAVATSRCAGHFEEADPQRFSRFITRHKDFALQAEKWAGEALAKKTGSRAPAQSLGDGHFNNLIYKEEIQLTSEGRSNYCKRMMPILARTLGADSKQLTADLHQEICHRDQVIQAGN